MNLMKKVLRICPTSRSNDLRSRGHKGFRLRSAILACPGEFPFTRGIYPTMYRGTTLDHAPVRRLWRRPRKATGATATCSNKGTQGFQWPSTCRRSWATTPTIRRSRGEVGRCGVAIDSVADMETLFRDIPLGSR